VIPVLAAALALAAGPSTDLRIEVWAEGRSGARTVHTLRCSPVGGTLPDRARACARLARLRAPFEPVPLEVACTQIYGGPEVAQVRGTFEGLRVAARFNRRNGCEIHRWDRVRFLLRAS